MLKSVFQERKEQGSMRNDAVSCGGPGIYVAISLRVGVCNDPACRAACRLAAIFLS